MHVYTWQPVTEVDARVIEENQKALALIDHIYMQKMYKDAFGCTALHSASTAYPTLSHTSHLPHKMGLVDHLEQLDNVIILRAGNQQPRDNQRCALKRSNQSDVIYYEEAN